MCVGGKNNDVIKIMPKNRKIVSTFEDSLEFLDMVPTLSMLKCFSRYNYICHLLIFETEECTLVFVSEIPKILYTCRCQKSAVSAKFVISLAATCHHMFTYHDSHTFVIYGWALYCGVRRLVFLFL